jgi:transposase-like protein
MFQFGSVSSEPRQTVYKQVDNLKEAWKQSTERQIEHANKYNELVKYAETVSESYIHSVNVIIDVTSLLNAYNDLLTEMSTGLNKLNEALTTKLNAQDIERLRTDTLSRIDNINNVFSTDFQKIKERISKVDGQNPALKELDVVQQRASAINTAGLRRTLEQRGGRKPNSGIKVKVLNKAPLSVW